MDISGQIVRHAMSYRYPNADIFILDDEYELPTEKMVQTAYDKYQKSLWRYNIFKWLRNKWDCDKFAWAFKASVTIGNALSNNNNAQPVGFLCYFIDGDRSRGHAINNTIYQHEDGSIIREIEPQPKGGIKDLTKKERDSAWLVVV